MINTELITNIVSLIHRESEQAFDKFSTANNTTYNRSDSLILDETVNLQRINWFLGYMGSIYNR